MSILASAKYHFFCIMHIIAAGYNPYFSFQRLSYLHFTQEVSYTSSSSVIVSMTLLTLLYVFWNSIILLSQAVILNESQRHLMAPRRLFNHYLTSHLCSADGGREGNVGSQNDGVIETGSPSISWNSWGNARHQWAWGSPHTCGCGQDCFQGDFTDYPQI